MSDTLWESKIVAVPLQEEREVQGRKQTYQQLKIEILKGEKAGEVYTIENGHLPMVRQNVYHAGELVLLGTTNPADPQTYYIADYLRRDGLGVLTILFLLIVLAVARKQGLLSILGLLSTFVVVFKFTIPFILSGHNPFLISILSVVIIIPLTFYLSHGWQRKTHAGVLATIISLILTVGCGFLAVEGLHLTGFASEDSAFLIATMGEVINIRGLLLAGIVIASLGVINDVTMAQASVVNEIKTANPKIKLAQLYAQSMKVGRDHVASMVDTLVLTYAGASLPLLVLLSQSGVAWMQTINAEMIAEEIARTLVGSIGLMAAVPITTIIAALLVKGEVAKTVSNNK